jgi:hypothetical protein
MLHVFFFLRFLFTQNKIISGKYASHEPFIKNRSEKEFKQDVKRVRRISSFLFTTQIIKTRENLTRNVSVLLHILITNRNCMPSLRFRISLNIHLFKLHYKHGFLDSESHILESLAATGCRFDVKSPLLISRDLW